MSQQSQGASSFSPADAPVKRKRGRPRKDDNQVQVENTPIMPGSESVKKNKQIVSTSNAVANEMVGQVVSGVIEGSFDAGYLLNVKVGDTDTHLRGVVFLPGRFTPVTTANDVAPNATMYKRKEIPILVQNPQPQCRDFVAPSEQINKQAMEFKIHEAKLPDQVPPSKLQSGVPVAVENQSASVKIPVAGNLLINETDPSLGEKILLQKLSESGLESQTASIMSQLKYEKVAEQNEVQPGTNMDVEAKKESEPEPAPFGNIMPCTGNVNQQPRVEPQALSSDLKPNELAHDPVKSPNIDDNQTTIFAEPESLSTEPVELGILMEKPKPGHNQTSFVAEPESMSSKPNGINIVPAKQNSPEKDTHTPQDTQSEVANNSMDGDDAIHPLDEAANNTAGGSYPASMTSLSCPIGEAANNTAGGSYSAPMTIISQPLGEAGGSYSAPMISLSSPLGEAADSTAGGSYSAPMISLSCTLGEATNGNAGRSYSAPMTSFSHPLGEDVNITTADGSYSAPTMTSLSHHLGNSSFTGGGLMSSLSRPIGSNFTAGGSYSGLMTSLSRPLSEASNFTAGGSYSAPMTSLSLMMFDGDTIPSEPKHETEGSVHPRMIETQIYSSSGATNNMNSDIKDTITPTHLDLSTGFNLSGSG